MCGRKGGEGGYPCYNDRLITTCSRRFSTMHIPGLPDLEILLVHGEARPPDVILIPFATEGTIHVCTKVKSAHNN